MMYEKARNRGTNIDGHGNIEDTQHWMELS